MLTYTKKDINYGALLVINVADCKPLAVLKKYWYKIH
jgi:hypothetical protein